MHTKKELIMEYSYVVGQLIAMMSDETISDKKFRKQMYILIENIIQDEKIKNHAKKQEQEISA